MRRVSSRQRLVSWDVFDATVRSVSRDGNESAFFCNDNNVDEDSYSSGYETATSQTFYSSKNLVELNEDSIVIRENNDFGRKDAKHWIRRRKRDRRSLKALRKESNKVCKNLEIPKTSPSITATVAAKPNIVPSHSWEISKPTSSKSIQFRDLIDDIYLGIFSFLDLPSLRSVMSLNRYYQKLMTTDDARNSVWMRHCEKVWHIKRRTNDRSQLKFGDNFDLPMAVISRATEPVGSKVTNEASDATNFSLLLSLTPTYFPTSIDLDILKPRTRLRRSIQQTIPSYREDEEDQLICCYKDSTTGRSIVRYTGYVGQGDRCIRTNHPLPRPSRATYSNFSDNYSYSESHRPLFMNFLRCSVKSMTRDGSKSIKSSPFSTSCTSEPPSEWIPFVVPFVDQSVDDAITAVNVTPRFVSYFEVSILKLEDKNNNNNDDMVLSNNNMSSTHRSPSRRTSYTDCVAVGVATNNFQFQSRMPGWDQLSYGYHGDDGGIFHSSGGMLKQFGPKYGPGDTVGCGIDYVSKGIFFTLNGTFLGYAWERLSDNTLQRDLFPVVGIDTNSPIHLNFGSIDSGPFQFDLSNFMKKHEKIITSIYSLDRLYCSNNSNAAEENVDHDTTIKNSGISCTGLSSRRQRKSLVGKRNSCGR